jgi:hypothetical protein
LAADQHLRRHIESVFVRAHFTTVANLASVTLAFGLELRDASGDACTQFGRILAHPVLGNSGTICRAGAGNRSAFLGVLSLRNPPGRSSLTVTHDIRSA